MEMNLRIDERYNYFINEKKQEQLFLEKKN
jgi:hypothetical protein